MSRIPGIDPTLADGPVSDILTSQKKNWGQLLNPYLIYARRGKI